MKKRRRARDSLSEEERSRMLSKLRRQLFPPLEHLPVDNSIEVHSSSIIQVLVENTLPSSSSNNNNNSNPTNTTYSQEKDKDDTRSPNNNNSICSSSGHLSLRFSR